MTQNTVSIVSLSVRVLSCVNGANNVTYSVSVKSHKKTCGSRFTDLLGKGMVGGGLGTVGIGTGRGPVPGMWTPAAV